MQEELFLLAALSIQKNPASMIFLMCLHQKLENLQMCKKATVALGGNYSNTKDLIMQALTKLKGLSIKEFKVSSFFQTRAISPIEQNDFFNAVCIFYTDLSPSVLFHEMAMIEKSLGKVPKPKEAPRPIDLDLLFYEILG
ncbi:2-amino-4-hydroxy-6-hydroxymethyldihydropteridine diphosphokinase [Candidatus Aerophobetes bacterium]|uniref:2-amino-4-hydroxy-6-hydroxymethyldihydropteridine diphosphokinase n=1 Tax=Aerophobetes bacterium TaxID=2030807 RepID=A0A2A4Y911_UNCAE|nr:MAG: 2-amino-4-hydroxy-6-hydroxymethyldihydropteridine diphosphokinase [Candidatus Aerophobetes bacterium]